MGNLIHRGNEGLVCNHPLVSKIWEWGGGSILKDDNQMVYYVEVMLKDDTRIRFKNDYVFIEAEKYLNSLPNE